MTIPTRGQYMVPSLRFCRVLSGQVHYRDRVEFRHGMGIWRRV